MINVNLGVLEHQLRKDNYEDELVDAIIAALRFHEEAAEFQHMLKHNH